MLTNTNLQAAACLSIYKAYILETIGNYKNYDAIKLHTLDKRSSTSVRSLWMHARGDTLRILIVNHGSVASLRAFKVSGHNNQSVSPSREITCMSGVGLNNNYEIADLSMGKIL